MQRFTSTENDLPVYMPQPVSVDTASPSCSGNGKTRTNNANKQLSGLPKWTAFSRRQHMALWTLIFVIGLVGAAVLISLVKPGLPSIFSRAARQGMDQHASKKFQTAPAWWIRDQMRRSQLVQRSCELMDTRIAGRYADIKAIMANTSIYVDDQNQLLYCAVPQSADKTWKAILAYAASGTKADANYIDRAMEKAGIKKIQSYTNKQTMNILTSYTKFLIVRHPFERLLMSYIDHFPDQSPSSTISKSGTGPTFYEVLKHLVLEDGALQIDLESPSWQSYSTLCSPCLVNYDVISRHESLRFEKRVMMEQLFKINNYVNMDWANQYDALGNSKYNVRDVFDSLSAENITALWMLYKDDFKMFRYTWSKILTE